jgi:hypothetical protein
MIRKLAFPPVGFRVVGDAEFLFANGAEKQHGHGAFPLVWVKMSSPGEPSQGQRRERIFWVPSVMDPNGVREFSPGQRRQRPGSERPVAEKP